MKEYISTEKYYSNSVKEFVQRIKFSFTNLTLLPRVVCKLVHCFKQKYNFQGSYSLTELKKPHLWFLCLNRGLSSFIFNLLRRCRNMWYRSGWRHKLHMRRAQTIPNGNELTLKWTVAESLCVSC